MKKIFAPGKDSVAASIGLLALRLFFGLTMLLHHGLDKLEHFNSMASGWADPLGVGPKVSLGMTVFAEVVAAGLLVLGLLTRFGALVLVFEMGVAFVVIHKETLGGPMPGEFAFIYFGAYLALLIAGPGIFSVDKLIFGKAKSGWGNK